MRRLLKIYTFLFCRKALYKFHRGLFYVGLKGIGILNHESVKHSGELQIFKNINLKDDSILIDCGARLGHYSMNLRKKFKQARIIAIEPNPLPLPILKAQAQLSNFEVYSIALSNQNSDQAWMYDILDKTKGTPHSSLYEEIPKNTSLRSSVRENKIYKFEVATQTLDKFLELNNIPRIDFLKLDCEGSELDILKGATSILNAQKITYIQFEFEHSYLKQRITLDDFKKILPGFDMYRILPDGNLIPLSSMLLVERDLFAYQNILCINKN